MRNYYEILEVDKNASQEVIEKAYKALAKKYHPDLQQGIQKQEYAEKMKIINEAYDILADNYKRDQYNKRLENEQMKNQAMSKEEQERIMQENYVLKQQLNNIWKNQNNSNEYIQNMQSRFYKHNLEYYLKLVLAIAITIFICFLIYQIPIVKKFFEDLYNNNIIFQAIVDIFRNTLSTTF